MSTNSSQPPILLSVDIQVGMVEGSPEWGPRSTPSLEKNVTQILSHWRSHSWPVIHIQHDDISDPSNPISVAFPNTYAIHSCAKPLSSEPVYVKHTGSAFVGTPLKDELEKIRDGDGKREVLSRKIVVIGMDGAQCINSTVRNGSDLGYEIVVVGDACATYAAREWEGEELEAGLTHRIAMGFLEGYAKVVTTEGLLRELGSR